jgi:hypothetical protein
MARKKNYSVGYGKPPRHSQFKKGVSGNKKWRPKGGKNFTTLFHQEMNKRIVVTENGKRRTITKGEAMLKQLTNRAAAGDPKAFQIILSLSKHVGDLNLPDVSREPQTHNFTLRVFEKDIETGESIEVEPGTYRQVDDNE